MMRSSHRSRFERIAAFTTGLLLSAAPLQAQEVVQPLPQAGAAERLSDSLRVLASNSGDVLALVAAGEAALNLDDSDTAYGFFARADVIAPTDPHVKAGLGRTLVRLERPDEALAQFARARALGLDSLDIASDRGLAQDLRGDFVAAQTDYQQAIRMGGGDEAVRRLALSQAIGGDARAALTTLAPLIARNDAPSWRARAFILAMDGDVPGARGIAQARMSPGMAGLFDRFFARLPSLNPAERARAVHFGDMPADGVRYASARAVGGGGAGTRIASGSPPPRGTVRARGGALIPQGSALGRRSSPTRPRDDRRQAARPVRARTTVAAAAPPPPPPPLPTPFRVALPAPPPEPTPYQIALPTSVPASPPPVQLASAPPPSSAFVAAPIDTPATGGPERDASSTGSSTVPAVATIPSVASVGTAEATSLTLSTTGDGDLPLATRPQAGAIATVDPDAALRPGDTVVTPEGITTLSAPTPSLGSAMSVPLSGVRGPDGPASLLPSGALPPAPSLAEAAPTPRPGFQQGSTTATVTPPPPSPPPPTPPPAPKPAVVKPKLAIAPPPPKVVATEPKKATADPKDRPDAQAAKPDPKTKPDPKAKPDLKAKPDAKAKPKAAPVPERYWYQVATGTSEKALAADLARMKKKYDLLAKLDGVTSEFGAQRRLVVGPFKTLAEAKAFGVKARTAGLDGYVWVSPEGFEVDALPDK